jgi:hypothetical protein
MFVIHCTHGFHCIVFWISHSEELNVSDVSEGLFVLCIYLFLIFICDLCNNVPQGTKCRLIG